MTPRKQTEMPEVIEPIEEILIGNRGEVAVRILKTCVEMDIGAHVGYAASDVGSLAVRQAVKLGETDDRYGAVLLGGDAPAYSYLDIEGIIAMMRARKLDAFHPGYGYLSESAEAARRITDAGFRFIGPSAEAMALLGGKISARALAEKNHVPVMPGTKALTTYRQGLAAARKIGTPFALKGDGGGGGVTLKFINDMDNFKAEFGDMNVKSRSGVFIEKKMENARHIEVQVAADNYGNVAILGERDCSAQRKSQKVIEESPAPIVPDDVLQLMFSGATRMTLDAGLSGLATFEFLYLPTTREYFFMEINPRLQVEHGVTEQRYTKLDLVEWQIRIARGEKLPAIPKLLNNHVIQARLYAEDAAFKATPGKLEILRVPEQPGLRVDRGYEEGDTIPKKADTNFLKYIVTAPSREEAREALATALSNTTITGITNNREFQLWLTNTPEFRGNTIWTTYIEDAWQAFQKERFKGIEGFIGNGVFIPENMPMRFVPEAFAQNLIYERRGKARNYAKDLERMHEIEPDTCAFKYGIYTDADTGIRMVLGYWDAAFMGGSLGSEEGAAVAAMFELAAKQHLPVTMIASSPGARQQEGAKALQMMDVMVAFRHHFSPSLFAVVYSGMNLGGVTVSIAESGDVRFALNGSKIGFAGPDLVARMMGKQSGKDLPVGAHSAQDHYADRNLELVVSDLDEARQRIVKLCADLKISNYTGDYELRVKPFGADTPTRRYDRPASHRSHTVVTEMIGRVLTHTQERKRTRTLKESKDLTPAEKLQLLRDPERPTAADYLDPALGLFETVSPLSLREIKDTSEEYPPIIAAIARLGGDPVMVIGQQTQRRRDETGNLKKVYVAPRAKDFRWELRQAKLANKLRIPIILFCDTTGGDASLQEEAQGVSTSIADFLSVFHTSEITVPVFSINIGENGSGGGLTNGRVLNGAADCSNSLTLVSTPEAQIKILTDKWPQTDAEKNAILNQLHASTAQARLAARQIQAIIEEPPGGAQADKKLVAGRMRAFLLVEKARHANMSPEEILQDRFDLTKKTLYHAMRPNK